MNVEAWIEKDQNATKSRPCGVCVAKENDPLLDKYLTHFEQKRLAGEDFNLTAVMRRLADPENGFGLPWGRGIVRNHFEQVRKHVS